MAQENNIIKYAGRLFGNIQWEKRYHGKIEFGNQGIRWSLMVTNACLKNIDMDDTQREGII